MTDRTTRRTRRDGRATRDRVLVVARQELAASGPVAFNLDRVIEASGVARSSIYHHFGDRAGVITAAETLEMLSAYRQATELTHEVMRQAAHGEKFIDFLRATLELGGGEAGRRARARRMATLVAAEQIPSLREVIAEAQVEGMGEYVVALDLAVSRGIVDPVVPVRGVAHLIQSVLLGRALVDLVDDVAVEADWVDTVVEAARALLRPRPAQEDTTI